MQRIGLTAEIRETVGKGAARGIRREGMIPAVLYGQGAATNISLNPSDISKLLHSESGENTLINLKLKGRDKEAEKVAIIRDFQLDPVTGKLLHADLFEISMDKTIRIKVPVEIIGGTPAGVKEGGLLQHNTREVTIECLPSLIPDHIKVDASDLKIGDVLHVREIKVSEGIKFLDDGGMPVVSVAAPISETKLEELLTATPAEVKEPEVAAKGKEAAAPAEEGEKVEKAEKTEKIEKAPKAPKAEKPK
ncbi:MAG: 50S ribosomal protein L25 [Nitrospirae bacterium]|nr:50S ribosomal protein L25 [Nitrospirota bacterium]